MSVDLVLQIGVALLGSCAVFLVYAPNHAARRWAPIAGLLGQPFWILAALRAEQWGILAVSLLYTYAWLRGAREQWRTVPAARDASHGESDEGKTMRVNVYAEEMTDRIEIISKEIDGRTFTGLRFYLELPVTLPDGQQHAGPFVHRPGDDDSAAVTFWGKRDMRDLLRKALAILDAHYRASDAAPSTPQH